MLPIDIGDLVGASFMTPWMPAAQHSGGMMNVTYRHRRSRRGVMNDALDASRSALRGYDECYLSTLAILWGRHE